MNLGNFKTIIQLISESCIFPNLYTVFSVFETVNIVSVTSR